MKYRAIFISDVHLGLPYVQVDRLLEFMKYNDADVWYLVGDIIDFWQMKASRFVWSKENNVFIQKLLNKASKGAKIYYIPGNHDEAVREMVGISLGKIDILQNTIYTTKTGFRFLITHGDQFDFIIQHAPWVMYLGVWTYSLALGLNHNFNRVRRWLGLPYWSFSQWAKHKVKKAISFIHDFERALCQEAAELGCQGVICGHIHNPAIKSINDILYINCGDWIENCTAVCEDTQGNFTLVRAGLDETPEIVATSDPLPSNVL